MTDAIAEMFEEMCRVWGKGCTKIKLYNVSETIAHITTMFDGRAILTPHSVWDKVEKAKY